MLIDTHVHLDFADFLPDREMVITRAKRAGVEKMITIGTDLATSEKAIAISEGDPAIFAAVGVHPHEVKNMNDGWLVSLKSMSRLPRVVAIGEIGLDFFKEYSPREQQFFRFRQQIKLAREVNLPVIIHDRDAHEEILKVLREEKAEEIGGVFHCFSGNRDFARKCLDMGFYISFTGMITFPKAVDLQEVAAYVPLDRFMVETDAPFLSPVPNRGKRNEPAHVRLVAQKIAEIRGIPLTEVERCTTENARALFKM